MSVHARVTEQDALEYSRGHETRYHVAIVAAGLDWPGWKFREAFEHTSEEGLESADCLVEVLQATIAVTALEGENATKIRSQHADRVPMSRTVRHWKAECERGSPTKVRT